MYAIINCHDNGSSPTLQGSDMDDIAVVIIQKENVLVSSSRSDRETPYKIRLDQFRRIYKRNENNVRFHWRVCRTNVTG